MAKKKIKTPQEHFDELDRDGQIQYAISRAIEGNRIEERVPDVPPSFKLEVGDAVIVGNLKDCVVVGMSEDKRFIAIEYHCAGLTYGKPYDNGRQIHITAWEWFRCVPAKDRKETSFQDDSSGGLLLQQGGRRNCDMEGLLSGAIRRGFWANPKYQRGYVWTDDDRTRLLDSIFKGIQIGEFVFIDNTHVQDWRYEVLDGQQRLTTLVDFVMSRFKYRGYYWHELSPKDRYAFQNLSVAWVELKGRGLTEKNKAQIFLLSNVAGVPQTEEHLAGVRKLLEE